MKIENEDEQTPKTFNADIKKASNLKRKLKLKSKNNIKQNEKPESDTGSESDIIDSGGTNESESENHIFTMLENMMKSFDLMKQDIHERLERVDQKMNNLETQNNEILQFVHKLDSCGFQSGACGGFNMAPNFSKIENKEEYLNENVQNVIQQDIFSYIKEQSSQYINKQHVYDVMNKSYSVYEFACNILHLIISENSELRCFYAFPFQKSSIYFWNVHKQTWEKMNIASVKKVFNVMQCELILCYNNMVKEMQENNTFHMKSLDFMENSEYIFCDDFDKKQRIIKKMFFEKVCQALS